MCGSEIEVPAIIKRKSSKNTSFQRVNKNWGEIPFF